jgi:hypothetical protein
MAREAWRRWAWRATVDEDGQYSFAVALSSDSQIGDLAR